LWVTGRAHTAGGPATPLRTPRSTPTIAPMFGTDRKRRRELERAMADAPSYEAWHEAAVALDELDGNDAWRATDDDDLFDATLLRRHIAELRALMAAGDALALESTVTESLFRNLSEVTAPLLYERTHTGETKQVTVEWLDTCVDALRWLRDAEIPGLSVEGKRARFGRALENLGQTALMLSGGGAWGLYHLGVVQALRTRGLLPTVICGSSMGAIVASGVGVRSDDELDALYADPSAIHRVAVKLLSPSGMLDQRSLLSIRQLEEHVAANVGDATFAEAFARTGRVLNVSVSPTRTRQKPRVLSYRTAPDVLVRDATTASCAVPGLFPAVALRQRRPDRTLVPYVPTERWVDGSIRGDLPMRRMGRLHNVNHFIVSQANPFVVPFVARHRRDLIARAARFAGSVARAQAAAALDETRQRIESARLRPFLDAAHALTSQDYAGDINIHPLVKPAQYTRVMANPSLEQLREYIRGGERATWRRLAVVRDQTRVVRELAAIVASL
jgi:TAG lipase/steryl ester hydrolase/phospholipase A2/LPA acyltransferase